MLLVKSVKAELNWISFAIICFAGLELPPGLVIRGFKIPNLGDADYKNAPDGWMFLNRNKI